MSARTRLRVVIVDDDFAVAAPHTRFVEARPAVEPLPPGRQRIAAAAPDCTFGCRGAAVIRRPRR